MSIAALERTRAAWIADEAPTVLECIHDRHVQLALWQRHRSPALDWLDSLDFDEIDDVQKNLAVESLASCLPGALIEAGYPDGPHTALSQEISDVAHRCRNSDGFCVGTHQFKLNRTRLNDACNSCRIAWHCGDAA